MNRELIIREYPYLLQLIATQIESDYTHGFLSIEIEENKWINVDWDADETGININVTD